jgi:uncharacterized membrane protein YedE/YeeE
MSILIDPEAWLRAAVGGSLIGAAAALLWAANGRIAGISGVLGGALWPQRHGERRWRLAFLAGLLLGPLLLFAAGLFQGPPRAQLSPWLLAAGLLVGFGTRLGSGCTSGHGICGLARFSPRSLAATATFMGFGFLTVWLVRHGGLS